jgi:hypothetical protein
MKKRFYLSLIVLAVLLLELGGLVVRSTAAGGGAWLDFDRGWRGPAPRRRCLPERADWSSSARVAFPRNT